MELEFLRELFKMLGPAGTSAAVIVWLWTRRYNNEKRTLNGTGTKDLPEAVAKIDRALSQHIADETTDVRGLTNAVNSVANKLDKHIAVEDQRWAEQGRFNARVDREN